MTLAAGRDLRCDYGLVILIFGRERRPSLSPFQTDGIRIWLGKKLKDMVGKEGSCQRKEDTGIYFWLAEIC